MADEQDQHHEIMVLIDELVAILVKDGPVPEKAMEQVRLIERLLADALGLDTGT